MADKIINRRPFSVNTDIDMDYKFFNHVNWKGICTDKNYFNLDQETFEDCKNVYIDADGLLKSRPSFKSVANDYDFYWEHVEVFPNNLTVYVSTEHASGRTIFIIDGDVHKRFNVKGDYKLIYQNKLFIFTTERGKYLNYYDSETKQIISADNDDETVYLPIVNVVSNGVKSKNEELNALTTWYRDRFIYTNTEITNPTYRNEKVRITVGDNERDVTFVNNMEKTIFIPKFTLTESNWYDGEPMLQISDNDDVFLISSVTSTTNSENKNVNLWSMTYSVDGLTFNDIPTPAFTIIGKPILSKDGSFVVVFAEDGPYAYSLFADNIAGTKTFPTWTNLLVYNELDKIQGIGEISDDVDYKCVGGVFNSPTDFAFSYGVNPLIVYGVTYFSKINNAIIADGKLYKHYFGFEADDTNRYRYGVFNEFINVRLKYNASDKTYDSASLYRTMYNFNEPSETGISLEMAVLKVSANGSYDAATNRLGYLTRPSAFGSQQEYFAQNICDFKYDDSKNYTILCISRNVANKTSTLIYKSVNNGLVSAFVDLSPYSQSKLTNTLDVLVADGYYYALAGRSYKHISLDVFGVPLSSKYNYIIDNNTVYSTKIGNDTVYIDVFQKIGDGAKALCPTHACKSRDWNFAVNKDWYLCKIVDDKFYIPENSKQSFDNKITNLHVISENQTAIFFEDCIWYSELTDNGYEFYKSKLEVGVLDGSSVINSLDGKHVIFSSTEGLVYLSYGELIQSTEQILTYLSDPINEIYVNFNKSYVKLFLDKYWLYCYNNWSNEFLVFDTRNNSWWKWEHFAPITHILYMNNNFIMCLNNCNYDPIFKLDYDIKEYYDYSQYMHERFFIDWHITSQKLHLNSLNYYKNIVSIIINNVETEDLGENVSYNLQIKNYRVNISNRYDDVKTLNYKVNMLRTYVKRAPSRKVNQFQYTLSNDVENAIQLPLSIHSVSIKYTMGGQVR